MSFPGRVLKSAGLTQLLHLTTFSSKLRGRSAEKI